VPRGKEHAHCREFREAQELDLIAEYGDGFWTQDDDGFPYLRLQHCPFCGQRLGVTG